MIKKACIFLTTFFLCLLFCGKGERKSVGPEFSDQEKQLVLANYANGEKYLLVEFLDRLEKIPIHYWPWGDSLKIKKLVSRAIVDTVLLQKALSEHLDQNENVLERLREAKEEYMIDRWYELEVKRKITASEGELKAYYLSHLKDYYYPEVVNLRQILVATRQMADSLFQLLKTGEDVGELARKHSLQRWSAKRGGETGFFPWGRFPDIEKVAFGLKENEISEPIKTKNGYYILQLIEKRPSHPIDFKKVRLEIKEKVLSEKWKRYLEVQLSKLRKRAEVSINEKVIEGLGKTYKEDSWVAEVCGRKIQLSEFNRVYQIKCKEALKRRRKEPTKEKILDDLINSRLMLKEAYRHHLDKDEKVLKKVEKLKRKLVVEEYVRQNVIPKIKVNEEEIFQEFTKQNTNIEVQHILVKTRKQAQELLKRIKNGANFTQLAKIYSISPEGKKGGYLRFVQAQGVVPEFEKVAFALKPGQVSDVVQSKYGYHIIKCLNKQKKEGKLSEEMKQKIKKQLVRKKMLQKRVKFFQNLEQGLHIQYNHQTMELLVKRFEEKLKQGQTLIEENR